MKRSGPWFRYEIIRDGTGWRFCVERGTPHRRWHAYRVSRRYRTRDGAALGLARWQRRYGQ